MRTSKLLSRRTRGTDHLEELFESQLRTLTKRGVPASILETLTEQKRKVLATATRIRFEDGRIPFLPVIPRRYVSIHSQVMMVRNGKRAGLTGLNPDCIFPVFETPGEPYFIFDVEDGTALLFRSPQNAERSIESQGRRGLTEVEVTALGVLTDVLDRHFVDAVGSHYGRDRVISLYLCQGEPALDWHYCDDASPRWGAASCCK